MFQFLLLFQDIDSFQISGIVVIADSDSAANAMGEQISSEIGLHYIQCKNLGEINLSARYD
jgi:hypothetical protein